MSVPSEVTAVIEQWRAGAIGGLDFGGFILMHVTESNIGDIAAAMTPEELDVFIEVARDEIARPGEDGIAFRSETLQPPPEAFAAFDAWLARRSR